MAEILPCIPSCISTGRAGTTAGIGEFMSYQGMASPEQIFGVEVQGPISSLKSQRLDRSDYILM